ncbi:hypothetical protein Patl1_11626 [Pistacia atlantica]|uniref:Uncharacterized protein n=1 Tax=Pistacia atlantica TaxID=434234 RepID=A0ACC1A623_9ROSI|nr:hypothetical protein Patl1_11626 [Pistacia atlantica]
MGMITKKSNPSHQSYCNFSISHTQISQQAMASRSQQCGRCGVYHPIPPHGFITLPCILGPSLGGSPEYEAGGLVNIVNNTMPIVQT